jgi:DNA-binding NtrC family response regulator
MPSLELTPDAVELLNNYRWDGNIRQLKNITEQISIIENDRNINTKTLLKYLPEGYVPKLPVLYSKKDENKDMNERDILYKILFDMRKDVTDLKKTVLELIQNGNVSEFQQNNPQLVRKLFHDISNNKQEEEEIEVQTDFEPYQDATIQDNEDVEESLSIALKEADLIKKALEKHRGKRKTAARDLGISERTLYRKIKEYDIN